MVGLPRKVGEPPDSVSPLCTPTGHTVAVQQPMGGALESFAELSTPERGLDPEVQRSRQLSKFSNTAQIFFSASKYYVFCADRT